MRMPREGSPGCYKGHSRVNCTGALCLFPALVGMAHVPPSLGANHLAGQIITFQALRNPHEVKLPRGFPGPVCTHSFCCWLENEFSKAEASLWSRLPLERLSRDPASDLSVVSLKFRAQSRRVAQAPGVTVQYCRCSPLVGKAETLF